MATAARAFYAPVYATWIRSIPRVWGNRSKTDAEAHTVYLAPAAVAALGAMRPARRHCGVRISGIQRFEQRYGHSSDLCRPENMHGSQRRRANARRE